MTESVVRTANGGVASKATETRDVTLAPRVDVLESDHGFTVLVDLPGVVPGDVDVRFENGELAVHGRRQHPRGESAGFFRSFRLNDQIAADKIEADLKHGVLQLNLPKVESIKPRRIAVRG